MTDQNVLRDTSDTTSAIRVPEVNLDVFIDRSKVPFEANADAKK